LIRALEIALWQESHPVTRTAFLPKHTKYIGIAVSREERNARIVRRLRARLDEGLVEEVRGLLASGLTPEDLLYYGLEYKYVTLYLTGSLGYEEMVSRLQTAIHQFAKRQMTWFRGMERRGIEIEWRTLS
jgi:tRNA dimethylallyltransferase